MENKGSRTYKAVKNTVITLSCQMVYLIMSFVCRTVFTMALGAEYLGVSGLFANILTILSFAELGMGSALVFRMYRPLAEDNIYKLLQYVQLYKKIYRVIIAVIAVIGLGIIPFLPLLVEAPSVKESITVLYLLYLAQTLVSYVFVYKKSVLIADQKNFVVDLYTQVFNIAMNIAQCIFLIITHDFVIYCVFNIIFNLANNIACSIESNRRYPYLKVAVSEKLNKQEVKGLVKDVKGLLLTKIASVAFSGTANIFISIYIGIKFVGVLSNYSLILITINSITNKVFDSITASIGNLVVTEDKAKAKDVLRKLFFINTSLYGYVCIGMMILLRQFVTGIWLSDEYELPQITVMVLVIELFLRSIHYTVYITRNAMGSFSEHKVLFACMAVLNIVLDFILVKPLGIVGIYIATIISRGITYLIDIWVVYKEKLQVSVWVHFSLVLKWSVFLGVCGLVCSTIVSLISSGNIGFFIVKVLIITFIYICFYLITFARTPEFQYFKALIKSLIRRGSYYEVRNYDLS